MTVGTKTERIDPTWRMKLVLRRELPEPLWRRLKKLTARVTKPAGGLYAGDRRKMIGLCSPRYSTSCEPVSRGATCRSSLARGTRSTRGFVAGVLRGSSPGCSRLSQREPQVNCGISIARTSSCIRTARIHAAVKLLKRSVELRVESILSLLQLSTVVGELWRSARPKGDVPICTRSRRFCLACATTVPSPIKVSTPTRFGRACAGSVRASVSRRNALAGGQWPFTAATTGGATKSKTSSAVSNATGASAPDTRNSLLRFSPSFSLRQSLIGSSIDFANTP